MVAGTYTDAQGADFELKGPVFDDDHIATWSIHGPGLEGLLIAAPLKDHPQLRRAAKALDGLPRAGVYALLSNSRYSDLEVSRTSLVNVRQVADTLVLSGYTVQGEAPAPCGVVVLTRKANP